MGNGEDMTMKKDDIPQTSMRSRIPSNNSNDGTASEAQQAHDEDAEAHWDAAAELS